MSERKIHATDSSDYTYRPTICGVDVEIKYVKFIRDEIDWADVTCKRCLLRFDSF